MGVNILTHYFPKTILDFASLTTHRRVVLATLSFEQFI